MKFLKNKNVLLVLAVIIFIISIFPILKITTYMHATADDYNYAASTYRAWLDTGSFTSVLNAALLNTKNIYNIWQGSFSAVFLMSMSPMIFSVGLYKFAALMLIVIFIVSNVFFGWVLVTKFLNGKFTSALWIILTILFISFQYIPSMVQGFMWFNGSWYYTFFYSLGLVLIGLMVLFKEAIGIKKWILFSSVIVICFIIGGSNYLTALMIAFGLLLYVIRLFANKEKNAWLFLVFLLVITISLTISILSPGNSIRAESFEKPALFNSLIRSVTSAIEYIGIWSSQTLIFAFSIILIPIIKNIVESSKIKFYHPILILFISFAIYASQYFPPLYAMQNIFARRLYNHLFFTFQIFWFVNFINLIGWLQQEKVDIQIKNASLIFIAIFAAIVSLNATPPSKMQSFIAYTEMNSGVAQEFDRQMMERYELLETESLDVELPVLTAKPTILYFDDIKASVDDWRNIGMARYYEKSSIYTTTME